MESNSAIGIAALVIFILANAFFVATEAAIITARRSRLEQLAKEGDGAAKLAQHILGRLDRYIATCQIGVTMSSLALGWVGEPAVAGLIEPPLELIVGAFAPTAGHIVSAAVAFALITSLHIVFGELVPKGLALQRSESAALVVARPINLFYAIFRWPVTALNSMGNAVLRLLGTQPASDRDIVHKVDELRLLVTSSLRAGEVEASEARIATRAFSFADLTAEELMTPRTEIEAISVDATPAELQERITTTRHTRIPVYEGSLDRIIGVLLARDVLSVLISRNPLPPLERLMKPPVIVFASWRADNILDEMRRGPHRLAVVQDEYGGTAGIVTFEDLVEALIGPIVDEPGHDAQIDMVDPQQDHTGAQMIDGLTRLADWEELAGVTLPEEDHEAVDTVGGLVMTRLGRIPEIGDRIEVDGLTLCVEELDGRRVALVRMEASGQTEDRLPSEPPA